MGRGRDFRGGGNGRGRHAHEEEHAALNQPPAYAAHSPSRGSHIDPGAVVEATVKWFNPEKGFGFVEIADGSGDAFLGAKALQSLGRDTVSPGAKLKLFVSHGDKGRQVTKIAAIEDSGESNATSYATSPPSAQVHADFAAAKEVLGKVKWFSLEKGMGFVEAEDGGKDVFVHMTVVKKARLAGLSEGQRISMRVTETPKGRQAVFVAAAE
jgi:CspA family cold shock protein